MSTDSTITKKDVSDFLSCKDKETLVTLAANSIINLLDLAEILEIYSSHFAPRHYTFFSRAQLVSKHIRKQIKEKRK